jgi:uncharacterized oxidoreductase
MPTYTSQTLTDFGVRLLEAAGLRPDEARTVAENLVAANLRGYDSHGVMRIAQYVDQVGKGELVPGAEFEVLNESPVLVTADAHWGFGAVQATRLTDRLVAKARAAGVGAGTMIHCGHVGRLGEYCERAAAAGLVSLMMVNNHGAIRRVSPPGGKAARLSTNPIAAGIPNGPEPVVLDFGTCATAEGKVRVKRFAGEPCPDGWLLDSEGRPTNDPESLYVDPPGTIRPFGGEQAYKGFGLGLLVEVLSGALSGGLCAREVPLTPIGNCVFMLVLDPEHFGGAEHFRQETGDLVRFVRGCPRVQGVDEITLPGDPERRALARGLAEGITLDDGNWQKLVALAGRLGVAPP